MKQPVVDLSNRRLMLTSEQTTHSDGAQQEDAQSNPHLTLLLRQRSLAALTFVNVREAPAFELLRL